MKIIKSVPVKSTGKVRLTVELEADEEVIALKEDANYRFNYPLEDQVVFGHHLSGLRRVVWDAFEQKWIDAG